ncbi:ribbon-helix-helix protein, CopG family [bacterium]|nr:ribbon-helix-helix protein, CopG family [bacterium]
MNSNGKSNPQTIPALRFVRCIAETGDVLTVTPDHYYRVLPDPAEDNGMLRVVDNTGEDYLYPAGQFEEVSDLAGLLTELSIGVTVPMKAALQEEANRRGVSVSALVRQAEALSPPHPAAQTRQAVSLTWAAIG